MFRIGPARARTALGVCVLGLAMALAAAPFAGDCAWAAGARKQVGKGKSGAADSAYATGVKAFQAGKHDQAVSSLSTAINGGLDAKLMARALYTRGLAYRKSGKSALAIADLSNALWLKAGLSDAELEAARQARTSAYAEAGLSAPSVAPKQGPPSSLAAATPLPPRPLAPVMPPPAAPARAAAPPKPAAPAPVVSGWRTATTPSASVTTRTSPPVTTQSLPAAPARTVAAAPPATPARVVPREVASLPTRPVISAPPPQGSRAPAPAQTSAAPVGVPTSVAQEPDKPASGGIGGLFTSLFGDMSLGPPPPPRPQVASRSIEAWADQTSIAPSGTREALMAAPPPSSRGKARDKASATSANVPAKAAKAEGKYALFVASAKTRQEAIRIATRLKAKHRRAMARQTIAIDPEKGEGDATVYSIKLGPYASANEPRNLCVKLRQTGFECRVLTP